MAGLKHFNYLDQLKDTEIDLTKYLENFSDDNYKLEFRNDQPVKATIKNLFEQITLIDEFKDRGTSFSIYRIKENEMPSDVAQRFYGSIDFWWVICLFNGITNPLIQWPVSQDQLNYLVDEYVRVEDKYSKDTYFNLLFEKNEELRTIDVLKRFQLNDLIFQFKNQVVIDSISSNTFTITI